MKIKDKVKNTLKYFRHVLFVIERKITKPDYEKIQIMSDEETIDKILAGYSISRYGDGELQWMLGTNENSFQKGSPKLKKRLLEVFNSNEKNHLVCLTNAFTEMDNFAYDDKLFWQLLIRKNWSMYKTVIKLDRLYGNANLSRPYMLYNNKYKKKAGAKFEYIKKIWDNKKILIVEGEKTRLGVGNDLMDNAKEIKRLICPSKDAFDVYDNILEFIKDMDYKADLAILALGPTATILAYDLAKTGIQGIDIGHIDIEYEWYKRNVKKRIPIDGKYVNECLNEDSINRDIKNKTYEKSIIGVINNDKKNN